MGGQGRLIGGLALCIMGVLGVCLTCGLPMWRETSFVGANIVTAQSVWDGLWLHCVFQSTGQMQCKRQASSISLTSDIQAGRALTLLSILCGLLGFVVTLLGAGVVNCSGAQPEYAEPPSTSSSKKKAALLGGALCLLSAILCLISVSWSAANTLYTFNDPLLAPSLKREVGSSIYIGWASSLLLLLGGALICFVCGDAEPPRPAYYPYTPHSSRTLFSDDPSRTATLRSDARSVDSRLYDRRTPPRMERHDRLHGHNPSNRSWTPEKGLFMATQPNPVRVVPSRATPVPNEYYYTRP